MYASYEQQISELESRLPSSWLVIRLPTNGFNWVEFRPPAASYPLQGWKIHVSVSATEAHVFARRVLPKLIENKAFFKVPDTALAIVRINSGDAGKTQIGKIVTIYPANSVSAVQLINLLKKEWHVTNGPAVPTDLVVSNTNAIYLRYGAFSKTMPVVDSSGRHQMTIVDPTGIRTIDQRSERGQQPYWVPEPPVICHNLDADSSNTSNEPIHGVFLPLLLIDKKPKGSIFFGIRVCDGAGVVIKTAKKGHAGDIKGFDAKAKLKNEFLNLQAISAKCDISPTPISFFETPDISTLVVLDVEAHPLASKSKEEQVKVLPFIAKIIECLHESNLVHRDIKIENFLVAGQKVFIIDFELASSFRRSDIPQGGTWGHIPPEGNDQFADKASDLYAFGALAAGVLLGCSPSTLPQGGGKLVNLLYLIGYWRAAKVVRRLTDVNPALRPRTRVIIDELVLAAQTKIPKKNSVCPRLSIKNTNWQKRACIEAAFATRFFLQKDKKEFTWRNSHFEADFLCEGINLGAAGIIIGLSVIQNCLKINSFDDDIKMGAKWLVSKDPVGSGSGLFVGSAGVALSLAIATGRFADEVFLSSAKVRLSHAVKTCREYDLFFGAAGILWASCIIYEMFRASWAVDAAASMAHILKSNFVCRDGITVWPFLENFDNSTLPFFGAAHGSAGIAMALARWSLLSGDQISENLATQTFVDLYHNGRLNMQQGALLRRRQGSPAVAKPREWCHGNAGLLSCVLISELQDSRLVEVIEASVESMVESSAITNPTYCHGMAGQLELFRLLKQISKFKKYARDECELIASALRITHSKVNGLMVWGADNPGTITPDLWVGFLGPASALAMHAVDSPYPLFSAQALCTKYVSPGE